MFVHCLLSLVCFTLAVASPEQAKWSFTAVDTSCHYFSAHATLLAKSKITFKVTCDSTSLRGTHKINIGWVVRVSPCLEEYLGSQMTVNIEREVCLFHNGLCPQQAEFSKWYYHCPVTQFGDFNYNEVVYMKTDLIELTCNHLIDFDVKQKFIVEQINSSISNNCVNNVPSTSCESYPKDTLFFASPPSSSRNDIKNGYSIEVPGDDSYLFLIFIRSQSNDERFNATVDVDLRTARGGYLTGVDRPLLVFYGAMSCVYVVYALFWFAVSLIKWKEILRIQFCIAGVILLGMIEKAIFYGVYEWFDSTGSMPSAMFMLAQVFSCLKRTLARVLFVIVSCGYEIVKPHLGTTLTKIIAIGVLYFILSILEACLRIYKSKNDPTNETLIAGIPLALLDSCICWWILGNLVQTIKILKLRHNTIKLYLFNCFTNVLIFSVLASICFMVWQIHAHKLTQCLTSWQSIWFDEAYWHILFSVILLAIMFLWRPSNNNQRYAFTPLLDVSDDDDQDRDNFQLLETGDLKSRAPKSTMHDVNHDEILSKETEERLRWIEQNIDPSFTDLVDSDEELINTKFEISKMQ